MSDFDFAAFALIENSEGKVLWKKRPDGLWDLPGGTAERCDSEKSAFWEEECCKREVLEETGLTVSVISLFGCFLTRAVFHHRPSVSAFFICRTQGGNLIENGEASEFGWFSREHPPPNPFAIHREVVSQHFDGRLTELDLRRYVLEHRIA